MASCAARLGRRKAGREAGREACRAVKLMGLTEIAALLGVSRQRAGQLADTEGFPAPVDEIAAGRIWEPTAVEAWAKATGRLDA